jgi:hypothetical protein
MWRCADSCRDHGGVRPSARPHRDSTSFVDKTSEKTDLCMCNSTFVSAVPSGAHLRCDARRSTERARDGRHRLSRGCSRHRRWEPRTGGTSAEPTTEEATGATRRRTTAETGRKNADGAGQRSRSPPTPPGRRARRDAVSFADRRASGRLANLDPSPLSPGGAVELSPVPFASVLERSGE